MVTGFLLDGEEALDEDEFGLVVDIVLGLETVEEVVVAALGCTDVLDS